MWYHTYNELSKAITTATQAHYETQTEAARKNEMNCVLLGG